MMRAGIYNLFCTMCLVKGRKKEPPDPLPLLLRMTRLWNGGTMEYEWSGRDGGRQTNVCVLVSGHSKHTMLIHKQFE